MTPSRIDTHCHFGGSIDADFVWEVISANSLWDLASTREEVLAAMTFVPGEPPGFHRFLQKFQLLDKLVWTEQIIERSVERVCNSLAKQQTDFIWMDFSVCKYIKPLRWTSQEAIRFIYDCFEHYRPGGVGLVLSLKYESSLDIKRHYAGLIDHPIADCLFGIDLVGDETRYRDSEWVDLLQPWVRSGKMVRAHVGEFGPEANVASAIRKLGVTNIAHGIKISDPDLVAEARDLGISFDLGISSNFMTGVVVGEHPVADMVHAGLLVSLGTDDPAICNTTLDQEYSLAAQQLTAEECLQLRHNAHLVTQRFCGRQISGGNTRPGTHYAQHQPNHC